MKKNLEKYCVSPDVSIRETIEQINRNAEGFVMVVDAGMHLVGTISDGDIRRFVLNGGKLEQGVSDITEHKKKLAKQDPVTAWEGVSESELLHLMNDNVLRHVPILNNNQQVCGIGLLSEIAKEHVLPMQAVVMAGGFGKRLMPLTENTPKPMLPVGGRPLIERLVHQLQSSGIHKVNVTLHHKPEVVTNHLGDGKQFGVEVDYVIEEQPLGTAGSLHLIERPETPFLVINGDILTDLNFREMLNFHSDHKADLTVAVRHFEIEVPYGVVEADGLEVTGLVEKPRMDYFVNAGIYLLEPSVCDIIPQGEAMDMTDVVQKLIENGKRVINFPILEYWLDIGRPGDYERAEHDVNGGQIKS